MQIVNPHAFPIDNVLHLLKNKNSAICATNVKHPREKPAPETP